MSINFLNNILFTKVFINKFVYIFNIKNHFIIIIININQLFFLFIKIYSIKNYL